MTKEFYAIAVISNPTRFKSRVRLFRQFAEEMHRDGVKLLVVELAYGNRHFEVTEVGNPMHLQLRTEAELWHKENMINLGVAHLNKIAPHWKYLAFIDADISFIKSHTFDERKDWVKETVHQLQHHQIVQMFHTALDLGPTGECFGKYDSFAWAYVEGKLKPDSFRYTSFHPGYAWAMRRSAFEATEGLIQTAILGAGDRHMAYAWIGQVQESVQQGTTPEYGIPLYVFQERAERYIQRDLGYVKGTIIHHFHGKKKDRRYHDRWKVLTENKFNPYTDLRRNCEGVLELVVMNHRQIKLRDDIRKYFRGRSEDSIDVE